MASDEILSSLVRYRQQVAGRYRAIKPKELGDLPPGELWVSPKIDGELAAVELREGIANAVTRGGRTLPDCPLMRQLKAAATRFRGPIRLVGELHCRVAVGSRSRVGDVTAAFGAGGPLQERLAFSAFDLIECGGDAVPADHDARLAAIAAALEGLDLAECVKTVRTGDRAEVESMWKEWGESGAAEGIIVRARDGRVFKVKPEISIDAVLMAFTTRCDAPSQVRSVLLGLARDDGTFQMIGGLGGVGGAKQREELLKAVQELEVPSALRQPSSDGGMYRFVRPSMVVEVNCTDVQAEDSSGAPIQRWIVKFDGEQWQGVGTAAGISLLHPQLVRVRSDKSASPDDAGFGQVAQRCMPPAQAPVSPQSAGNRVKVAMRRVWTKSAKGKDAVRKILVWDTGHDGSDGWPAWIVHFTDYSPDRKTPLERTFRTARSKDEALHVAERIIAENVKKGWTEVP